MIHKVKQNIQFWNDMTKGLKPFEIRKNDRPYAVGDLLELKAVGECCNYCDGISYKCYYNGICKGWQNCYEDEAETFTSIITEVIKPEDYNTSSQDPKINKVLKEFFNSDYLMEDYVILMTASLPKL